MMHGEQTMASNAGNSVGRAVSRWRVLGWGTAVALILTPLVAMQFTSEVNWSVGDFIFAALMFGIVGALLELAVRTTRSRVHRAAIGVAIAASFLTVWVNGAVGMIGSEENPYNLLFLGVIGIALVGSVLARFRAAGMALAMAAAACAQAALGLGGLVTDLRGGILGTGFAGLWLISAALFRTAAQEGGRSS
jgi:hypothetical protein